MRERADGDEHGDDDDDARERGARLASARGGDVGENGGGDARGGGERRDGRKEREKLTSTLTEKTLECEKLRRERDLIVADAKCEASGAVRAMREELESLRARALERAEHFDRERERKSRELEELDGHVALAMDVLRKTLEEEVVRARCRESSPLKTSRSRDTPTSAPTSPRSETSRSLGQVV